MGSENLRLGIFYDLAEVDEELVVDAPDIAKGAMTPYINGANVLVLSRRLLVDEARWLDENERVAVILQHVGMIYNGDLTEPREGGVRFRFFVHSWTHGWRSIRDDDPLVTKNRDSANVIDLLRTMGGSHE